MINPNEIENPRILPEIKNIKKNVIEYEIPFPEPLARSIEKFVDKFHTSYEKLFNYLLNNHFNYLHYEIKEDDNELLIFYYFCVDDIFSENNNSDYKSPHKSEMNTQNITVKIFEEYNAVIKEICEEIYHKPELFISKAIRCQWERIQSDIDAGYYYIIDDFCNISRIKQALEEVLKESETNKNISKNE
ncbi:MAG: hypothetical protein V3V33_05540 [Candidatus Lokiarchaeia archaeon]